jgi:hypothetical protein
LAVQLKVSDANKSLIDKTLRIIGDRCWENSALGVRLSKPAPFTRMPIQYERAYGGTDKTSADPKEHDWEVRNPVGVGFATRAEHLLGKIGPNVEDPSAPMNGWRSRPRPAGFGPIPGHWAPRTQYVGTYDDRWKQERFPLYPLDFSEQFYQCAPEDQQVPGFLKGGESAELTNLTPGGALRFRLPRVTLAFTTAFGGRDLQHHRAHLHTVVLEPDEPRLQMVWHTNLPCHFKVLKLLHTTIRIKRRLQVSPKDLASGLWVGPTAKP